jgi:acetyl-CoA C-acetyltransferase
MISDGAGAVVIASPEVARNCRTKPVWIIGTGESVKYRINDDDMTVSAGAQSAPMAFGEAGVRPDEIDVLTVYDSFTPNVIFSLEDLGFCKKGRAERLQKAIAFGSTLPNPP